MYVINYYNIYIWVRRVGQLERKQTVPSLKTQSARTRIHVQRIIINALRHTSPLRYNVVNTSVFPDYGRPKTDVRTVRTSVK